MSKLDLFSMNKLILRDVVEYPRLKAFKMQLHRMLDNNTKAPFSHEMLDLICPWTFEIPFNMGCFMVL